MTDQETDEPAKNTLLKRISIPQRLRKLAPEREWSTGAFSARPLLPEVNSKAPPEERYKIPTRYDVSKQFAGGGKHFTTMDKIPALPATQRLTEPSPALPGTKEEVRAVNPGSDVPNPDLSKASQWGQPIISRTEGDNIFGTSDAVFQKKNDMRLSRTRIPRVTKVTNHDLRGISSEQLAAQSSIENLPVAAVVQIIAKQVSKAPQLAAGLVESEILSQGRKMPPEYLEAQAFFAGRIGLLNFRHFVRILEYEIERAKSFQRTLYVTVVSVDNVQEIGMNFGTAALDSLEETVCLLMRQTFRKVDIIARFTEGRFIVACPEIAQADLEYLAQALCFAATMTPAETESESFNFTLSIGSAQMTETRADVETLVALADLAVDDVVAAGGNAVCFEQSG